MPESLAEQFISMYQLLKSMCHYCGGSTLACCEHSSDSVEELNKRVREGAD